MSNTDDENIQKISKMLEIGGTMLAQHCGSCGAPLFRYQGRVLCPVCEDVNDPRESMQKHKSSVPLSSAETESYPSQEKKTPVAADAGRTSFSEEPEKEPAETTAAVQVSVPELESLMIKKMISLANSMQDENDVRRVDDYLDIIDRCMDIVVKMRKSL